VNTFQVPWIEIAILVPLLGAAWVHSLRTPQQARRHSLFLSGVTLVCTLADWLAFTLQSGAEVVDRWSPLGTSFVLDSLNAPLLPLMALLYLLTLLATQGTKLRHWTFGAFLASESILLATISTQQPWLLVGLLAAGVVPPWLELRSGNKPLRVYTIHMGVFVALLVAGQALVSLAGDSAVMSNVGVALLLAAVLLRSGIVPVHCWMTDLFEHARFGTALLFVTPMVGAYAALRLVLPIAPDWALQGMAILSITTALYAASMALVQREARRFFCYVFLSHSSLVFVGLETGTAIGLTGALCAWMAVSLSMTGFGLVIRAVEARTGRLSLDQYHGLQAHTPLLAALFLLTGLASIGFPGTVGFIGSELLVEGAVQLNPIVGIAMVLAAALNGLAVLHAYFRVFTGTRHLTSIDLRCQPAERFAVLLICLLILGGGLFPQPGVSSRYSVAKQLVEERLSQVPDTTTGEHAELPQKITSPRASSH
jgi:NADH-quinone oxidoreductase subunit M